MDAVSRSSNFLPVQQTFDSFVERIKGCIEKIKDDHPFEAEARSFAIVDEQKNGFDYLKALKVFQFFFPRPESEKKVSLQLQDGSVELTPDEFEALKKESKTIQHLFGEGAQQEQFTICASSKKTFEKLMQRLHSPDSSSDEIDFDLVRLADYLDCSALLEGLRKDINRKIASFTADDLDKAFALNSEIQTIPPFENLLNENLACYLGWFFEISSDPHAIAILFAQNKVRAIALSSDSSSEVFEEMKNISSLQSLHVDDTCVNLTDDHLANLPVFLESLTLSDCFKLTDAGLKHLKSLSSLKRLDISHCTNITDEGLEHIKSIISLTQLNLESCNKITDKGLKHLSYLTSLTTLILTGPLFTDAGFAYLKLLTSLTTLLLSGCEITDTGVEHLKSLISLRRLRLRDCVNLTDACLDHFKSFKYLTSLDLSYCITITGTGLVHLTSLSITDLNLSFCKNMTDRGLTHLKGISTLRVLDLSQCPLLTDEGLELLKSLNSLLQLSISGCVQITDKALLHVKSLGQLIQLNFSGCLLITNAGLGHLVTLSSIRELTVSACGLITDEGLNHLKSLKSLKVLYLFGCDLITDEGIKSLSANIQIKR